MHFTREPVVETTISAKGGHRLSIRKVLSSSVEYLVESVQMVSYSSSCFYRSMDGKGFVLPVDAYEILEVKDARIIIKHPKGEDMKENHSKPSRKYSRKRNFKKEQKALMEENDPPHKGDSYEGTKDIRDDIEEG